MLPGNSQQGTTVRPESNGRAGLVCGVIPSPDLAVTVPDSAAGAERDQRPARRCLQQRPEGSRPHSDAATAACPWIQPAGRCGAQVTVQGGIKAMGFCPVLVLGALANKHVAGSLGSQG